MIKVILCDDHAMVRRGIRQHRAVPHVIPSRWRRLRQTLIPPETSITAPLM